MAADQAADSAGQARSGKPTVNMREVVNGMMYVLRTSCHQRSAIARRGERLLLLVGLERQGEKIHDALYVKCRELPEREARARTAHGVLQQ